MAAFGLTIPKQAWEALGNLSNLTTEQVGRMEQILAEQPVGLDVEPLAARISEAIDLPARDVKELLLWVLIPVADLAARPFYAPEDVSEGLIESALEQAPSEWKARLEPLPSLRHALTPLFTSPQTRQWVKAQQLRFERPAYFDSARVLTDLRPLYDHDVSTTEALIVSNTLIIEYTEWGSATRKLFLDVDSADLEAIAQEIDRAKKKIHLARQEALSWKVRLLEGETQ